MKKLYPLVFMLLLSALSNSFGQALDTINLKAVDVKGSRSDIFSAGIKTMLTDTSHRNPFGNQPLSELLSLSASVFIKSYGSGGAATISARGTEARHSSVMWNGFNINSSSLGLTDLSLVPAFLTDGVTLLHGGSSAVNGNSAIGSTLLLENSEPLFVKSNTTSLLLDGGSFGNMHCHVSTRWNSKSMNSKTTFFYDAAENNFTYTDITHRDRPEVEQEHGAYSNYGLIQDFQFKIKPNHFADAGIWYQVTAREIPAMMMVPESFSDQRDSNWRVYAGYRWVMPKSELLIKGAAFSEFQYYDDDRYRIHSRYHVNNYFGDAEWRYFANEKMICTTGISFTEGVASFKEYAGTKNRTSAAVFAGIRYRFSVSWQAGLNLRQEFSNITTPPLTPSLSVEGNLYKQKFIILAQVGRHFNLPSMNDLYWIPGGNPLLEPEHAWTEEISLIMLKHNPLLPSLTLTVFNSMVDNWIKWQPSAGGIYTPDNLRQVHARGSEVFISYIKRINQLEINLSVNYTWCRSTVKKTEHPAEIATIDKQLMYIPEHVFNGNISIRYHNYSLFFSHAYVGERYTTTDNSEQLAPYTIGNLSVEKYFKNNSFPFLIYLKIMNIYNSTYQVLAYHPTPGRWYSAGVKINFSIPNPHKSQNQ